jgi:hypothetical protein
MSLFRNEQAKLTANYLNGLAFALFAVGALAPPLSILTGDRPPTNLLVNWTAVCILASSAPQFRSETHPQEARAMTLDEFIVFMTIPVGGLLLGARASWIATRPEKKPHHPQPSEPRPGLRPAHAPHAASSSFSKSSAAPLMQ